MKSMKFFIFFTTLILGLLTLGGLPDRAYADTVSFPATADVLLFDGRTYDNDFDMLYVGIESNSAERSAIRFTLGNIPGTPTKYELFLPVYQLQDGNQLFSLNVHGSTDNNLVDNALNFPSHETSMVTVYRNQFSNNSPTIIDVTSLVHSYTDSNDRNITFVLKSNEPAGNVVSRLLIWSKENPDVANQPKLVVTYDTNSPPTGAIQINSGNTHVNSTAVNLNLSASDPNGDSIEIHFSNDNVTWSTWESFNSTKAWTLTSGDSTKTVYYQLKDSANAISSIYSDSIVLDTTNPVITGATNGGLYNRNRTITFNEGTATINGSNFTSGATVSSEGTYTLVVTDVAGNRTVSTFIIDKTAPIVSGVTNGASYNTDKTITFSDGTATLNDTAFSSGSTVSSEGVYTLVVADAAGNSATITFTINKTAPTVTGVTYGASYNTDRTITFSEGTATLNDIAFSSGATVSAEGAYTLVVTDAAGNSAIITFTINKTAPTVTGVTYGASYNTDRTITFSEGTATLNDIAFSSGATVSAEGAYTLVVTDAAGNSTTVAFTIDKTRPTVTGVVTGAPTYTAPVIITFNEGTATLNGESFLTGTTVSMTGSYALVVTDAASNVTSINFTISIASGGGEAGSMPVFDNFLDIKINNDNHQQMAKLIVTTVDGKKITNVIIDNQKLISVLNMMPNQSLVSLSVMNGSDRVIAELNGKLLETLDNKKTKFHIQTNSALYDLSASHFNIETIANKFGSDVHADDIKISFEINNVQGSEFESIRNKIGKGKIISPAVQFKLIAHYNGNSIEINNFLTFVERKVAIPDGIDHKEITTGVVVTDVGEIKPVYTRIVKENGQYYAVMYSMASGTYVLVNNEVSFLDVEKHWAKASINDMASKLIINGIDEHHFGPNRNVTRAEFVTILVRALGLQNFEKPTSYVDVKKTDWYYEALSIAESNGLLAGKTGHLIHPNEDLTRQEAVHLLSKAMKLVGMEISMTSKEVDELLSRFKDSGKLSAPSRDEMALNIKYGIIGGNNGQLLPHKTLTRAEAAALIERFMQKAQYD
ncbi:S-layer homology domain-containing protein [Paenibacillus sp. GSMTC-2017]|uniref:S-layer homology domain-containing protein n=1 Tax=Paenibacillus sp. GSMTC-2017 TaxID=2794350 RepID=UPI0018D75CBC|nr:S-layer homology domain-containing protein [Paenibacillus sp. GSMTC-2017]MBH5318631.1 S-layer homology domain-containing protein [Paenibacillus sp. GSMTC-2017]